MGASLGQVPKISPYKVFVSLALGFGVAELVLARELILWPFVPINDVLIRTLSVQNKLRTASELAFLITSGFYAGCLLLLLHVSARTSFTRNFLGIGSLALLCGTPLVCWLSVGPDYPVHVNILLLLETVFSIFSIFYLPRKLGRASWHLGFILATHYALWIWLFWWRIPSRPAILIPGFAALSSAVWFGRGQPRQPKVAPMPSD